MCISKLSSFKIFNDFFYPTITLNILKALDTLCISQHTQTSYNSQILDAYTLGQIHKKYSEFIHGILVKALSHGKYDSFI